MLRSALTGGELPGRAIGNWKYLEERNHIIVSTANHLVVPWDFLAEYWPTRSEDRKRKLGTAKAWEAERDCRAVTSRPDL